MSDGTGYMTDFMFIDELEDQTIEEKMRKTVSVTAGHNHFFEDCLGYGVSNLYVPYAGEVTVFIEFRTRELKLGFIDWFKSFIYTTPESRK